MSPLASGSLTFISAVGALFTKTLAKRVLELTGFRRLLIVNAIIGATFIAINGFFAPSTPHWLIMMLLFTGGCFRSMQFTSLNAIAYADVSHRDMSSATSLSSVAQQLSLSVGVALGAMALESSAWMRGAASIAPQDFSVRLLDRRGRLGAFVPRLPEPSARCRRGNVRSSRLSRTNCRPQARRRECGTTLISPYHWGRTQIGGPSWTKRIIDLYDDFTHGGMNRRAFIDRLAALAGSTAAATALLPILQNNYAQAQTMPESDPRITAETVDIPGAPGLKGYLVKPKDAGGKLPAVIVIHENRGPEPAHQGRDPPHGGRRLPRARSRLSRRPWAARPPTRTRAAT